MYEYYVAGKSMVLKFDTASLRESEHPAMDSARSGRNGNVTDVEVEKNVNLSRAYLRKNLCTAVIAEFR